MNCPLCAAGGKTVHESAHLLLHAALRHAALATKGERDALVAELRRQHGDQFARDAIVVSNVTRAWARQKDGDAVRS